MPGFQADNEHVVRTWIVIAVCRDHLFETLSDIREWITENKLDGKVGMPIIKADHRGRDEILIRCSKSVAQLIIKCPSIQRMDNCPQGYIWRDKHGV